MLVLSHRALWSAVDLSAGQLLRLVEMAQAQRSRAGGVGCAPDHKPLAGRHVALVQPAAAPSAIGEFARAVHEAGGQLAVLNADAWLHARAASLGESARLLGRLYQWVDCCDLDAATVEMIERDAGVPVTDGLARAEHPLYLLADMLAIREVARRPFGGLRVRIAGAATTRLNNAAWAMARQLKITWAEVGASPPPADASRDSEGTVDAVLDTGRSTARTRVRAARGGPLQTAALRGSAAVWRRCLLDAVIVNLSA